jgi:hypothetical protein
MLLCFCLPWLFSFRIFFTAQNLNARQLYKGSKRHADDSPSTRGLAILLAPVTQENRREFCNFVAACQRLTADTVSFFPVSLQEISSRITLLNSSTQKLSELLEQASDFDCARFGVRCAYHCGIGQWLDNRGNEYIISY